MIIKKGDHIKFILISLITICLSLLAYPYEPALHYSIQKQFSSFAFSQSNYDLHTNQIIIPSIFVKENIVEGTVESSSLDKGAWHIPNTGTPLWSNMVLAGHRFKYLPPHNETFYLLDKLKKGEKIYIIWEGHIYTYTVNSIYVVLPTDTHIEEPTKDPILTLYTCTPLWSADKRLVIESLLDRPKT